MLLQTCSKQLDDHNRPIGSRGSQLFQTARPTVQWIGV